MSKLKVINLWAGPGAGKSTTAAALFNLMKRKRYEVELVTEVAKDYTYERATARLGNQLLIFAEQEHRLRRLAGQCEYVVCDSPFPLGLIYASPAELAKMAIPVLMYWQDYVNFDFWVMRTKKPFQQYGRNHTEDEARDLDAKIRRVYGQFTGQDTPGHAMTPVDPDDPSAEYKMLNEVLDVQGLPDAE